VIGKCLDQAAREKQEQSAEASLARSTTIPRIGHLVSLRIMILPGLPDLSQALLQAVKLYTNLHFHGIL
jgi:hypothetical protein